MFMQRVVKLSFWISVAGLPALVGCAAGPQPNIELVQACIAERVGVLSNEWARYESMSRERVFYPDWRSQVRQWARIECSRGRPVAAFRPSDTTTARRHY